MTPAERKEILRGELDRARNDVSPLIYTFARFCEQAPPPAAEDLAEAATELYLKIGRVAALANVLAGEAAG